MDSSYLIQTLQIKKMLGEITKEENVWFCAAKAASSHSLDSWANNNYYRLH